MFENIYKNKRVLVTGHTGFKGSWLTEWLLHLGAKVYGYSLYIPSEPSHFTKLNLESKITHTFGDIKDLKTLEAAFKKAEPEIVFHLAAQPIVSTSIQEPRETFETNVMGTINVLECIRSSPTVKAAVIVTSDKCYENVEWEFGYRETDQVGGKDPYSASKGCAEIAFHSYYRTYFRTNNSPSIATGRAGNVIGGGDWAKDRIVPDCVRSWADEKSPLIRSLKATRPWQHVLEPLSGYLELGRALFVQQKTINGESFNFGPASDTTATVEQLLNETKKYWPNKTWHTNESQTELSSKEAGLLKLNCDKSLHRLSWKSVLTFPETVRFTADWYRSYYEEDSIITFEQISKYVELASNRGLQWSM
ncbi:MAG: CDP-glucose 4,6-dehydratase [Sphingobacteriales bacterium]|nr:MAG: CDP-glucose 4,6-dehydratase [Sphingobacteriales bacterium]